MTRTHEIRLTGLDVLRLERALMQVLKTSTDEPQGAAERETLLDSAAIVPPETIEPDVVTMNSPAGRALIGARVGDRIRIVVPGHGTRELVVAELTYQPEANGRFDL